MGKWSLANALPLGLIISSSNVVGVRPLTVVPVNPFSVSLKVSPNPGWLMTCMTLEPGVKVAVYVPTLTVIFWIGFAYSPHVLSPGRRSALVLL